MSIRRLIETLKDVDMEWRTLGDIGEFTYGHVAKAQESGNARFVRITDIDNQGQLIATDPKYVDINQENERFILKKNDLLMARTGATYGKTMIFEDDYPAIYAGFLIRISLDKQLVIPRFYWHFAQSQYFWNQANKLVSGGGQPQFNANVLRDVVMPIPCPSDPKRSLEIQGEIVRILDTFTELTAELTAELNAELTARKKQYNYYRDQLLRYDDGDVEWKTLAEIAYFQNAKAHERLVTPDGDVALLTSKFISTEGRSARFIKTEDVLTPAQKNDIALVMSDLPNGRALAKTFFVDESGRYAANQRVCLLTVKDPSLYAHKFLHYVMNRNRQLLAYNNGMDQTHLKKDWILNVTIPVPPLAEQVRVVAILDKFDVLSRSITEGLPREIELRQKQYEYYRDLLLSFPKPDGIAIGSNDE